MTNKIYNFDTGINPALYALGHAGAISSPRLEGGVLKTITKSKI